jgi:hypothetical protein
MSRDLPCVKVMLVLLTVGQSALPMWVFVSNIVDKIILGLDIL